MKQTFRLTMALLAVLGAVACSPEPQTVVRLPESASESTPAALSRTLVALARGEPSNVGAVRVQAATPAGREMSRLFYATLDFADERGTPRPYLAEALPSLNGDSWRVFPDGRMETTHRLRERLTWHDGAPLSAEDFVFAKRVYSEPVIGVASSPPISEMDEVLAPDPRTIVIRWRRPYPEAGALLEGFQPLPRHIIEASFQEGNSEAFMNLPYWTHQYVGLGPYRLDRWEPGTAIEATAFDGHALGRPKIPRIRVRFTPDTNAALATLLSGDAHLVGDLLIPLEQTSVVQRSGGITLLSPVAFRISQIQLRPEMGSPRELGDVRVRAAIAHAIDKQAINEAIFAGHAALTDSLVSPLVDYYPAIDGAIRKYPYDPRRTQQLLEESGLVRGSDGFYATPGSDPLPVEVRAVAGAENEAENTIIVAGFRQAGLHASTYVFPVAQLRDNQAVTTFPVIFSTGRSGEARGLVDYASASIPRADNRWFGGNRGGWANPEFDRLWQAYNTTLDRSERIQRVVEMERLFSEHIPGVPHYYGPRVVAHVAGLRGPAPRTTTDAGEFVNVHKWEWAG